MGSDRNGDRFQGTELGARRFLLLLLVGSVLLVGAVAWPLASALLVAAVLGVVLAPLQERLARALRGRSKLAATLLVLALLVLVIAPLVALSAVVVNEVTAGVKFVVETVRGEGFEGLIHRLPAPLERLATEALSALGDVGQFIESNIGRRRSCCSRSFFCWWVAGNSSRGSTKSRPSAVGVRAS